MTTTVTVSEFRENLSKYIDLVNEKDREVRVIDGRKGKVVGKFVKAKKKKEFDWDKYMKFLKNFKPIFTDEDVKHIEKLREADRKRFKELNW